MHRYGKAKKPEPEQAKAGCLGLGQRLRTLNLNAPPKTTLYAGLDKPWHRPKQPTFGA
jgi:hypothetical protein